MPLTKAEAALAGYPIHPVKHRMTRRALWHQYWRRGRYGITIHLNCDENGMLDPRLILSQIVGRTDVAPRTDGLPIGFQADHQTCLPITNPEYPSTLLTDLGRLIEQKLLEIGKHRNEEGVFVESYVLMPTHIHFTLIVSRELPVYTRSGKEVRWTIGNIIRGFEQGCTSWYLRLLEGESVEHILSHPTRTQPARALTDPTAPASLWHQDGYNDRIFVDDARYQSWCLYLMQNPYYWRLRMDYPLLFEHRLHLHLANVDYSAYGCIFLLRRIPRIQLFCHRAARKGMLTPAENAQLAADITSGRVTPQLLEQTARQQKLGHFSRDWVTSSDPAAILPIPYIQTQAFQDEKARLLSECEEGAVLVSPAVSPAEQDIFYAALDAGYPCIKLRKEPFRPGEHPTNRDRQYCAAGLLLVLGPWQIEENLPRMEGDAKRAEEGDAKRAEDAEANGTPERQPHGLMTGYGNASGSQGNRQLPSDTQYAQFHNLNAMAALLCQDIPTYTIDRTTLQECR